MTDSKTPTERLRELLYRRGVKYRTTEVHGMPVTLFDSNGLKASVTDHPDGYMIANIVCPTPEQAIAATLGSEPSAGTNDACTERMAERLSGIADEMRRTGASSMTPHELLAFFAREIDKVADSLVFAVTLGRPKAKSHPWGYEPDTGCFDATRCECGCINDVSAQFCNDCGGEIEIDESAPKEIYKYNRNSVFAVKHDDGSLEFGGKRYVAATLGGIEEPDTIRNELADGGLIADVLAPVCVDEKERRAFERGKVHERFAQQIFKEATS